MRVRNLPNTKEHGACKRNSPHKRALDVQGKINSIFQISKRCVKETHTRHSSGRATEISHLKNHGAYQRNSPNKVALAAQEKLSCHMSKIYPSVSFKSTGRKTKEKQEKKKKLLLISIKDIMLFSED